MRPFFVAFLAAWAGLVSVAAPGAAQTYDATMQPLPAPIVLRMPVPSGGAGPSAPRSDRPVRVGEFATRVRSERDRVATMQRVLAERFAREKASIAAHGAGVPVELRAARY